MIKRIIFLLLPILLFNGCTRDDICPEGTATTPKLVLVFKNDVLRENRKEVKGLSVETDYENSILVLATTTTDSIAIPLSTTSDTTKYRFIRTLGTGNLTEINIDRVMFIYNRKDLYVTRACGFKTEFYNLQAILEDEGSENWIKNITKNRDTINDENKAHFTFYH
ncbi:hypothetical protein EI546_06160 [Aequorivita sp. H23M31]|uniref:Uncharacterized protein n=1 Tax=Aequorivita ciconiae TaxID=2494375 RepID=A0A410G271_9FLAO|nr:DUF6452 family protein [Aequorivita sp. H23M31]QAA81335.1 hypothetical protein EI546_06160 [Aequorivita sp. H23M31]